MVGDISQENFQVEDYKRIFNEMQDCYLLADMEGTILLVNPSTVSVLGYDNAAELIGKNVATTIYATSQNREKLKDILSQRGVTKGFEIEFRQKNGNHLLVECDVRLLLNEQQEPFALEGLFRDITERKKTDAVLRANIHFLKNLDRVDRAIRSANDQQQMLQGVIEIVHEIFTADRTWLLYPCDPDTRTCRVPFEYTEKDYPGVSSVIQEIPMVPSLAQECRQVLNSEEPLVYTISTDRPVSTDSYEQFGVQSQMITALNPKAGRPWMFGVHQCSHPRHWSEDEQKLFKEIGHRLTDGLSTALLLQNAKDSEAEIKKHHDHLEDLVKERTAELTLIKNAAEAANKAKSDFLARMSHEIRTPLNAVTGLTNVVLKSELTTEQRDHLNKVKVASGNLLEVINDILDFSKVEAGRLELTDAPFDLDQLLEQVSDLFNNSLAEKDLELIIAVPPSVPRQLKGDSARLAQILTNLVDNAIKFTVKGEIVIEVSQLDQIGLQPRQIALQIRVKDTGIGIDGAEIPTLFDPFSQVDSSLTRERRGTGLGLAICRRLAELMGGTIQAESIPGQGSIFTFTVLLTSQKEERQRFSTPNGLHGLKTMVVDDSAIARQVMRELLESFTFDVSTFDSGEEAIEELKHAAADTPYQLIMLDWKMPGKDGLDTAKAIRTLHGLPNSPTIIMVTAYGHELVQKRIDITAVDSLLLKPVKPSGCFNTIMEVFDRPEAVVARAEKDNIHRHELAGKRVLVAEDNQLNLDVAVALLEEGGMLVETAENGLVAVDKVTKAPTGYYDFVLMDIQMPVLDGYEAARQIRQSESMNNQLPIIALTAHALKGEKEKCLDSGMVDYIAKPIDEHQLWKVLLKWIQTGADSADNKPFQDVRANNKPETSAQSPGIDFQSALTRLRGRQALFERVLRNFEKEFGGSYETIRQSLSEDDRETAIRLAHTLKGTALMIGATKLAETSAELEKNITDQRQSVEQKLNCLQQELHIAIEAVNVFLEKTSETEQLEADRKYPPSEKRESIGNTLQQLLSFLESGNMKALDTWREVKCVLQEAESDQVVTELNEMIDRIDFNGASLIIKTMLQKDETPHG